MCTISLIGQSPILFGITSYYRNRSYINRNLIHTFPPHPHMQHCMQGSPEGLGVALGWLESTSTMQCSKFVAFSLCYYVRLIACRADAHIDNISPEANLGKRRSFPEGFSEGAEWDSHNQCFYMPGGVFRIVVRLSGCSSRRYTNCLLSVLDSCQVQWLDDLAGWSAQTAWDAPTSWSCLDYLLPPPH